MSDDADIDSKVIESITQSRIEQSAMLVGLGVGVFTVLTILTGARFASFAWWVLSVTYFAILVAAALTYRNWAATLMITDAYIRKYDLFDALEQIANENAIRRFFFFDLLYRNRKSHLDGFLISVFVGLLILAVLVWYVVAFEQVAPLF